MSNTSTAAYSHRGDLVCYGIIQLSHHFSFPGVNQINTPCLVSIPRVGIPTNQAQVLIERVPASSNVGQMLEVPMRMLHKHCRLFPAVRVVHPYLIVVCCCQQTATIYWIKTD